VKEIGPAECSNLVGHGQLIVQENAKVIHIGQISARTSSEPNSVMEFGFKQTEKNAISTGSVFTSSREGKHYIPAFLPLTFYNLIVFYVKLRKSLLLYEV